MDLCNVFHKQSLPFPLMESFKETKVFRFSHISLMMTSIKVFMPFLLKCCLSFICTFSTHRCMCMYLIKLGPTEFLRASFSVIYPFDKYVLNSFNVLGLLLRATDIKMSSVTPFQFLQGLRMYWDKQLR